MFINTHLEVLFQLTQPNIDMIKRMQKKKIERREGKRRIEEKKHARGRTKEAREKINREERVRAREGLCNPLENSV